MKAKEMSDFELIQSLRSIAIRLGEKHNEQSDWAADIIREAAKRLQTKGGQP